MKSMDSRNFSNNKNIFFESGHFLNYVKIFFDHQSSLRRRKHQFFRDEKDWKFFPENTVPEKLEIIFVRKFTSL